MENHALNWRNSSLFSQGGGNAHLPGIGVLVFREGLEGTIIAGRRTLRAKSVCFCAFAPHGAP
jgi:hypothetical protein